MYFQNKDVRSGVTAVVKGRRRPILVSIMLDAENWKIVFKVYAKHPISALTLAYQLIAIKQSLQRGHKGIPDATAGLDLAIKSLYSHTDFHKIGRKFYPRTIKGTLTPIFSFLEECGVPKSIMIEVRRQRGLETLKMIPALLERLYERGDEGFQVARTMLTKIYYWKDIHSVPADRKDQVFMAVIG